MTHPCVTSYDAPPPAKSLISNAAKFRLSNDLIGGEKIHGRSDGSARQVANDRPDGGGLFLRYGWLSRPFCQLRPSCFARTVLDRRNTRSGPGWGGSGREGKVVPRRLSDGTRGKVGRLGMDRAWIDGQCFNPEGLCLGPASTSISISRVVSSSPGMGSST